MKLPLTKKENEVLAYIYGYIIDHGFSPIRKEIADKINTSNQGADYFVMKLVKKGKLKITNSRWRNIKINE